MRSEAGVQNEPASGGSVIDNLKIWLPNSCVLGTVTLVGLEAWLKLVLVSLSIAYTIWRWRRDAKKKE